MGTEAKIIRRPTRIFLNVGDVRGEIEFSELEQVTWSQDRIHPSDIEYSLLDERNQTISMMEGLIRTIENENAALKKHNDQIICADHDKHVFIEDAKAKLIEILKHYGSTPMSHRSEHSNGIIDGLGKAISILNKYK